MPSIPLTLEDLWKPQRYASYNEWICNVTFALATQAVKDRVFRLSAPMCYTKPEFATLMFPFLLLEIIFSPSTSHIEVRTPGSASSTSFTLSAYLSYNIRTFILPDSNTNTESTQLILTTLNFLRKQFMLMQEEEEEGSSKTTLSSKRKTTRGNIYYLKLLC